jgi:hypothetical protein
MAIRVNPQYISGPQIYPQYIGAPVEMVQAPPMGDTVQYSQQPYVAGNLTFAGFGRTVILAGATQRVTVNVVKPITPQKILCPSTVTGLLVVSVSIGGTNLFCNELGVPIEVLSEVSTSKPLNWLTIEPSVGAIFELSNPTVGDLEFKGAFYGTSLRT